MIKINFNYNKMFGGTPKKRQKLFNNFISEFNIKLNSNLELSEDVKSEFVNRLLSRDKPEAQNRVKFISTFYYPRIVDIRDIEKNRDIEIFTPIPKSMKESLESFYKQYIMNFNYKLNFKKKLEVFPNI